MEIPATIVSKAHEVVLERYSKTRFVCVRCGFHGYLWQMFDSRIRCIPHRELKSSGWLEENDDVYPQHSGRLV